jgi:hypothetical protein
MDIATTTTYKGYRIVTEEWCGTVMLYSPSGDFLEFVDSDEDAWYRIDHIWTYR